jgi:deoxyribonuclease V
MRKLHNWDLDYNQAVELQKELAQKVEFIPLRKAPKLIAGIDCAFTKDKTKIIGCVVILSYPELKVVEIKHALKKVVFPYIPGLLSFREAPVCLAAVEKLKKIPDIFMVDGQGIAHPRRLGLAAHLGLFFNKPTIGCAKSRLIGTYNEPGSKKGNFSYLYDGDEKLGAVVRTRDNVKPVFISVGNLCSLDDAVKWVLNCSVKYRLPVPTRTADIEAAKLKSDISTL